MSSSTYSIKDAEASGRFAHGFELNTYNISTGARSSRAAVAPYYLRSGHEKAAAGGGGVLTSARDMSIWVSMLLNNGRHLDTNETIVPEEVVNHAATGVTVDSAIASYPELVSNPLQAPTLYGSGQRIYSYRGHEIIEHGGSIMGFKSQVTRYPNDNLAIVVLSNDFNAGLLAEAVKRRITDEIFGLSPIDWDTRYSS
ncbi:hypothetical protein AMATHDRAFT_162904 [Amanita thiersii Skay4041]|uniref:Beta-lactamase-related domain-containing protein n=1 Tax=Amanita thiersii Skay4041 TaxID=703135 RepID=A0A2A9NA35_9AGAR|nr:hypothetical protein AMATHDRAFT_162904 [Amanita thiersii Skay4041]